jgi:hypothetical protein
MMNANTKEIVYVSEAFLTRLGRVGVRCLDIGPDRWARIGHCLVALCSPVRGRCDGGDVRTGWAQNRAQNKSGPKVK